MIAADTSTWIAFFEGERGDDVGMLAEALRDRQVVMAPAVLTDLLSDPELPDSAAGTLSDLPLIETEVGYWERAGRLQARVLAKKRKARLGDALIAQSCFDSGVSLLTRDRDFRSFADAASLRLVIG
ncbi:MAG: PIN domain-containing protein [Acidobacteriaceae bacterium]